MPWRVAPLLALLLAGCGDMSFDAAAWRAEAGNVDGRSRRLGMVGTLKREHLKPGVSRQEVVDLLGQPDLQREGRDVYVLGRGDMAPDYETLELEYDASGRLTRAISAQS